ncbi:hypothetical protein JOF56_010987 [Kibdelosporangium banguiense]|uniref:NB-ARC domain-containing protein n=1 Tax=Kibdelosporangium banguiense TaxID=1365924 RepID=A0ABS4U1R6_9PSEU|nr:FxSxx-COOH system tetratricopeptide repeat protein [Kibdelosporangium banguiense]MBP2330602.1 hypothetical protein [Kibdelosporangium banguiense]
MGTPGPATDGTRATSDVDARGSKGVQIGNNNTMSLFPRPDVSWPVRVGVVPQAADCYQDRDAQRHVQQALADDRAAVVPAATAVLFGLGGVGKTQMAARHARGVWTDSSVDVAVWVAATSRDAVITGYAHAATHLLVGAEGATPEQAAASLLAWLAGTDRRWLIVLDDVQAPADLRGLWPPSDRTGQVIVTTRRQDTALARADRHLIEVGVFTAPESKAYLATKLPAAASTADGVTQLEGLADDLGHLPLALAQAAAFIADKPLLTPATYRRRLADRRKGLAEVLPDDQSLPDDHQQTVAATWSLSIELANLLTPVGLARPLLEIASVLDPVGIPTGVVISRAVCEYLTRRAGRDVDLETAGDTLGCLHRLSLITFDTAQPIRAVRVHALVQRATRDAVSADRLGEVAMVAADALLEIWPEVERDADLVAVLRANTAALHAAAESHLWNPDLDIGGHPVLFRAGNSLGTAGQLSQAVTYYEHLHTTATQHLAVDHPDTLTIRHNIARQRGEAGDATGAIEALEHVLTEELRVLGADHPSTLTTRGNIAYWRGASGDIAGAVEAFELLLTDRLRVLGPDHPSTLTTRGNIAYWRGEAGDATGAIEALEHLLTDRLRVLGPDHPSTLTTRHNIARWRGEAGDIAGAIEAFEHLLTDRLRVLGPDHPSTLTTRHNIAYWRGEAGDATGAIEAFEHLLTDRLRVLGPDHPSTLTTRHNIARWRGEAGDIAGAIEAFEHLLTDRLRVLGPDHPSTLTTRHNIAHWQDRRKLP